eukprot:TRINITY_DN10_c0_g1_i1.p1 TRINITY_DN10_c0_g1~~TRINITY_DN10_c0_g1_i1.p1  ORF type:complete len:164 (+),score=30.74 TRINITY_DN10_c0_g1_i1:141-632(+)
MALFQKLGSALRQSLVQAKSHLQVAPPAGASYAQRFLAADAASAASQDTTKLFVGGLAWQTDESALKEAFEAFGQVSEAKVITDRITGRSRGFGFVTFESEAAAEAARNEMDGRDLAGRLIKVDFATIRPPGERAPRTPWRGGGGGGGRGRGYDDGPGGDDRY